MAAQIAEEGLISHGWSENREIAAAAPCAAFIVIADRAGVHRFGQRGSQGSAADPALEQPRSRKVRIGLNVHIKSQVHTAFAAFLDEYELPKGECHIVGNPRGPRKPRGCHSRGSTSSATADGSAAP